MMEKIYWAKVKENAKIPSKRWEDAGYDLYPCFAEDYMEIQPNQTELCSILKRKRLDGNQRYGATFWGY